MNLFPNKLLYLGILLCGVAGAAHAEKADHNKPMQIASDTLNVDDANHISTFEGKVDLTQGTLHVTAEKIVVTEDAAGNKFCVATGRPNRPASFRQKREALDEYVEGYGERIEYDTRIETVNFYIHAKVKRDQDEVRGDHIIYSTQTEIFHVDGQANNGRVHATIQPKNQNPPEAAPHSPSPKTNVPPQAEKR